MQYIATALAFIIYGLAMSIIGFGSGQGVIINDCRSMGQSRVKDQIIVCEVKK